MPPHPADVGGPAYDGAMTTDEPARTSEPSTTVGEAASVLPPPTAGEAAKSDKNERRIRRIRLLNEELDRVATDATSRAGGVANKASFLAVSAGVLITAATAQMWGSTPLWGFASLVFATIALGVAAVALRPGSRPGLDARRLVDRHLHCDHHHAEVEFEIVRDKADALTAFESDIAGRGRWVWGGFGASALSAISLVFVVGFETLGG